jgi:hypothetical protein
VGQGIEDNGEDFWTETKNNVRIGWIEGGRGDRTEEEGKAKYDKMMGRNGG